MLKRKGNARIVPANPDGVFLPFQSAWVKDASRLKLIQKSRQIGLSWSTAYACVERTAAQGALSAAAKNIATLTRSSVSLKEFQVRTAEAARKKLLEEQKAALATVAAKPGVTRETMAEIRRALGIDAGADAGEAANA